MKNLFHGFYELSEIDEKKIFLSKDTVFVFDSNCFFNLYRCEKNTRKEVMKTIECVADRIWFPFQVCFEYQRNRLNIIKESLTDFNSVETHLKNIIQILGTLCGDKMEVREKYKSLHTDLCILRDEVKKEINDFIENKVKAKSKENDYISKTDDVRKWVETLSQNRIGKALTQEQVDQINKMGEKRYKYKVGPGWGDDEKKQEYYFDGVFYAAKYGDLYIWNEILNKSENEDIKAVVFVTNDEKSDWWYKLDKNKDIYGSLEVLKTELMNRGSCKFKMYTQPQFLKAAKNYLKNVKIDDLSIQELEHISTDSVKNRTDDVAICLYEHNAKNYINRSSSLDAIMRFMNSPEMRTIRDIQNSLKHTHLSPETLELFEKSKKLRQAFNSYNNQQSDATDSFRFEEDDDGDK